MAGSAANGVNFLLDGGDNNDAFSNVNLPIPFPDAVQEFNVQANGLPAQYGLHPGGVVNIVTKSGTNALHGDVFRVSAQRRAERADQGHGGFATSPRLLKRNQFGGTAGGPIIKDKLFFFGGYQGTRQRSDPANQTAYVPTAATLKGNFSVVDGAKSAGGCLASAKTLKDANGNPYPGNQIPVSTFDPAGLKLASTYLPVSTDPCGTVPVRLPGQQPRRPVDRPRRLQHQQQEHFFGRFFIYDYLAALAVRRQQRPDHRQPRQPGPVADHDHRRYLYVSPTLVNSFHATFDRRRDNRADPHPTIQPERTLGVNIFWQRPNYTQLTVSSYSGGGFDIGCGTCALANFDINTYQVADDFTIIRGKHQFAFGFDGRKDQFNSFNNQQSNGQFTVQWQHHRRRHGGPADRPLFGLTDGNVISDYLRQTVIAAYVQDAFHATPHFTINFGVRWEPSVPAYDKYGRGNQFSWPLFKQGWHSSVYPNAPAGLVFSTDRRKTLMAKPSRHPIGRRSRRGWAWFGIPKGDGKQTIRASFNYNHDTTDAVLSRALDHQFAVCVFDPAYQWPVLQPVRELHIAWQDRRSVPRRRGLPDARRLRHHSGEHAGHWRDDVEPQLPTADCHQLGGQSQLHG